MADHEPVKWGDVKPGDVILQGTVVRTQHRTNMATFRPETRLCLAEGGMWSGWSGWLSSSTITTLAGEQ